MLRWVTTGESRDKALIAPAEDASAGFPLTIDDVSRHLARRRLDYGRGARMKFEVDEVTLLTGIRRGETPGALIGIMVGNSEWLKWTEVASADPADPAALDTVRGATLTRSRPRHADFNGMLKYSRTDARDILERSSVRKTTAYVTASVVTHSTLHETPGIEVVSHVVSIGRLEPYEGSLSAFADQDKTDESPVRASFAAAEGSTVAETKAAEKQGGTLSGTIEVVIHGLPVGLESHISGDARLNSQLAGASMGAQSVKGVKIGDSFKEACRRGIGARNEMVRTDDDVDRGTNHAGGLESGITNAQSLAIHTAMKPIPTTPRALKTVDIVSGDTATAIHQHSDVYAVLVGSVVAEAIVALILARAMMGKFGGDSLGGAKRNVESYLEQARRRLDWE